MMMTGALFTTFVVFGMLLIAWRPWRVIDFPCYGALEIVSVIIIIIIIIWRPFGLYKYMYWRLNLQIRYSSFDLG